MCSGLQFQHPFQFSFCLRELSFGEVRLRERGVRRWTRLGCCWTMPCSCRSADRRLFSRASRRNARMICIDLPRQRCTPKPRQPQQARLRATRRLAAWACMGRRDPSNQGAENQSADQPSDVRCVVDSGRQRTEQNIEADKEKQASQCPTDRQLSAAKIRRDRTTRSVLQPGRRLRRTRQRSELLGFHATLARPAAMPVIR